MDYRTAFDLAPIGLVLSRDRLMVDCNQQVLAMFGAHKDELIGQSFEVLYPTHDEFERTGQRIVASLDTQGWYADERVMKRSSGELFWCHVSGRALVPHRPAQDWSHCHATAIVASRWRHLHRVQSRRRHVTRR